MQTTNILKNSFLTISSLLSIFSFSFTQAVETCAVYDSDAGTLTMKGVAYVVPAINAPRVTKYYDVVLSLYCGTNDDCAAYNPPTKSVIGQCPDHPDSTCLTLKEDSLTEVPAVCDYTGQTTINESANLDIGTRNFSVYYERDQQLSIPDVIADGTVEYSNVVMTLSNCPREVSFTDTTGNFSLSGIIPVPCFKIDLIEAADPNPDPFSLGSQSGVALNTFVTSDTITVTGINTAATISVTNGEYSLDGGTSFTSVDGTVNDGDTVIIGHTSASTFSTDTTTTLTIDTDVETFTSTTVAEDTTPDAFTFTDITDQTVSTEVSTSITLTGFNSPNTTISVTGGEYSLDGGTNYTSVDGTIDPNVTTTVHVKHTTAAAPDTSVDTTLTVGGISDTFTSTTAP